MLAELSEAIGVATNNVAEYRGLIFPACARPSTWIPARSRRDDPKLMVDPLGDPTQDIAALAERPGVPAGPGHQVPGRRHHADLLANPRWTPPRRLVLPAGAPFRVPSRRQVRRTASTLVPPGTAAPSTRTGRCCRGGSTRRCRRPGWRRPGLAAAISAARRVGRVTRLVSLRSAARGRSPRRRAGDWTPRWRSEGWREILRRGRSRSRRSSSAGNARSGGSGRPTSARPVAVADARRAGARPAGAHGREPGQVVPSPVTAPVAAVVRALRRRPPRSGGCVDRARSPSSATGPTAAQLVTVAAGHPSRRLARCRHPGLTGGGCTGAGVAAR